MDIEGIASYSDLYLQMPELMPLNNHHKSHVNNTYIAENIHNETAQEIVSLLDMQKNIINMQSQINSILSVIGSKNATKSRFINEFSMSK